MAEPITPAPPPAPAPPSTSTAVAIATPPAPLTYRDRLAQFRILEEKRHELIEVGIWKSVRCAWLMILQELLAKLEATEARLAQTELDLNSEQNVRRTLQSEAAEAKQREDALAQKQVCEHWSNA